MAGSEKEGERERNREERDKVCNIYSQRCLCVFTCKEYTNLLWVWLEVRERERETERKEIRYVTYTPRGVCVCSHVNMHVHYANLLLRRVSLGRGRVCCV